MCKRNKVCIYMFIVVMVLQIIIPALSVILETSYTLTSEAADNILETWDNIGAEGSKITAKLYNTKTLYINGTGKIKDNINWYKNNLHYELLFKNIIINKKEWVVKMPIPFSHIFLMNYHVVPWNTLLSL